MAKLYELLIRFHPDGSVGAAAYHYEDDGVTPNPMPLALHTDDFPALSKTTISDLLGQHADILTAASANSEAIELAKQLPELRAEYSELLKQFDIARGNPPIAVEIHVGDNADSIAAKIKAATDILQQREAMLSKS